MLAALTAALVGQHQEAGVPLSLGLEHARTSPPLAGMEGLLAAVQASSSGEGSGMEVRAPGPAKQGSKGHPSRLVSARLCPWTTGHRANSMPAMTHAHQNTEAHIGC